MKSAVTPLVLTPVVPIRDMVEVFGRPILYTSTTQRGCCMEAFVSILVHSQSQTSLPGGGGSVGGGGGV